MPQAGPSENNVSTESAGRIATGDEPKHYLFGSEQTRYVDTGILNFCIM